VSISPFAIIVLVAAAIAVKVSVLIGIAVAAFRRFDRWPVYGVWYQEQDQDGRPDVDRDGHAQSPVVQALAALWNRDMRRIQISRSGDTVTVRSADGSPLSFGGSGSRLTRSVDGGLQVEASWQRQGDVMKLESYIAGEGRVAETYECAGSAMLAELRITVPGSDLDKSVARRFRRSASVVA
jgi:hypothetical protein